jgi:hypothetical protein
MTIQEYIEKKPYLVWHVKDYEGLSKSSILEAVINYGDWQDVQAIIKIIGIKNAYNIYRKKSGVKRTNYRPEIKNYFTLYFKKYA